MADAVEARISTTSVKRVDPYVKEILATSTHVALYKFNTASNAWEKTETEGALFVYSRNGEPYHSIMVLNRLNTNNLIEPLVKDFDYQMQVPFLLYRNSKSKIYGIWFFNREECIQITYLIETLMEGLNKGESGKENGAAGSAADIFSMLSRAEEDFNKTPTKQEVTTPAAFSTPRDCTSKSVMDFFAKASTKSAQKSITEGEHVLQRLMSNPAHSVEHIEKQQRSITPQDKGLVMAQKPSVDRRSVPISFPSTSERKENSINWNEMSSQQPQPQKYESTSPLAFILQGQQQQNRTVDDSVADLSRSSPFAQFLENAQQQQQNKPQLMTPMMFTPRTNGEKIDLLTEKQLAQALIHLLKTNPNFTRQIHEAYVSSIMEKVNCNNNSLI